MAVANLTDEDVKAIVALSKDERIAERVNFFTLHLSFVFNLIDNN